MTDRENREMFLACLQAAASAVGCYWTPGQDRDPPTYEELVTETIELANGYYQEILERFPE